VSTEDDSTLFAFFNEIGIIEQLARTQFERALPGDLRMSHFQVLNHFVRLGGEQSPVDLARAFQVTKGAMTNTLHRLEDRGLIDIRPDPKDGRSKIVTINEKGRKVREEAVQAALPLFMEIEKKFSKNQFKEALPFLRDVRSFLDQNRN